MATVLEPGVAPKPVAQSSDRSFGMVFAVVFALIGCWPFLYLAPPRWWALAIAAAFLGFALVRPALLAPLNRWWLALGALLHKVVSPLVMGAIFFLCVTPIALLMRLFGKDVLALRRDPSAASYWIVREPAAPQSETMRRQF